MQALGPPIGADPPTEAEAALARESGPLLAKLLERQAEFQLQSPLEAATQAITVPRSAVQLLAQILAQMAQGHAVTLVPIRAELSTQRAAELLNVSRPFMVKLLDEGRLPYRKVGKHRRIRLVDVLAYKRRDDEERRVVLVRLASEGQALQMGY